MENINKKSNAISNRGTGYVSFNDKNKGEIVAKYGKTLDAFDGIVHKTTGSYNSELVTDIRTRTPYSREDYNLFRPNEKVPKRFKDIVKACRQVYWHVGIIRNVIDMMTDFACEGMKIVHPDKKIEAFYKTWMGKVKLQEVTNEFIRHFLVDGNVVVKRGTAVLPKPVEKEWSKKTYAKPDEKIQKDNKDIARKEIPWKYTFLNILALNWVSSEEDSLTSTNKQLVYQVSNGVLKTIRQPENRKQIELVNNLSHTVTNDLIKNNKDYIPLDMEKVYVEFNKKDSWDNWAPPFLISVLSDIYFREKLRQAETSALDGVINVVRLWKLGDHKEGILPDDAAVSKLINILEANTGGGTMDIVWDSMIAMEEFYPPVDKILGSEKYTQVNRDILIGLGVPEVLIGGQGANFSNSFIQLKTLVEKLEYIRKKVLEFISGEVKLVADGMGFTSLPKVKFSQMNLQDENVSKRLIVGLLDRGIISVEAVLESYGEDFLIEVQRIKNENAAGIESKGPFDEKVSSTSENTGKGRPAGTKEVTRKTRNPKVRTTAFALDIIDSIDENIIPIYMETFGVKNARMLTNDQKAEIDEVRASLLSCIKYGDDISKNGIINISENNIKANVDIIKAINVNIENYTSETGSVPTLSQRKRIEALTWAEFNFLE